MHSLLQLIDLVLSIYSWLLILSAIMSWLVAFNIINPHHRIVQVVGSALYRITEPILRPVRSVLPNLGGIDLSPVVVLLLIFFLRSLLREYWPF